MSQVPVLEVVIGLSFIFFVFSLICSAITEWIATKLQWRARMLETAIVNLLSGSESPTKAGRDLAGEFWDHPLIQSLQRPKGVKLIGKHGDKGDTKSNKSGKAKPQMLRPSYIPSRTFVLAVLDLGRTRTSRRSRAPAERRRMWRR